jgi:hypothetical protein
VIGLRQGCVLSPVLFGLFVNDLILRIKKGAKGVKLGWRTIWNLFFADDVVVFADSKEDLQKVLDICHEFAIDWGLVWNTKKGKTEILVFGGRVEEGWVWRLGENVVNVVDAYKYLGVFVGNKSGFGTRARKELMKKAKKQMWSSWMLMGRENGVSVLGKVRLWQTMVQSVLEMGAEFMRDCKWEEAEKLQRKMGRMILGCGGSKLSNEVVQGELGLWSLRGRRWRKRLMFWMCIETGRVPEIVEDVYEVMRWYSGWSGKWCEETKRILVDLGLGEAWERGWNWDDWSIEEGSV